MSKTASGRLQKIAGIAAGPHGLGILASSAIATPLLLVLGAMQVGCPAARLRRSGCQPIAH